jgi:hypothetical protein
MKLYLYKTNDGRYLADMEAHWSKIPVIGAVNPETDGNYFKELHVCAIKENPKRPGIFPIGMKEWWEWFTKEALPKGYYIISDEFEFDPKKVKIVEFVENKRKIKSKSKR